MTTVITRLFEDEATAQNAADKLVNKGVPRRQCSVIVKKPGGGSVLKDAMLRAQVHERSIDAYAEHVAKGRALLVARTTYKPLMAASITRDILANYDTFKVDRVVDDYFMPDKPEKAPSIFASHPRFLTVAPGRTDYEGGPISSSLGMRMVSKRKHRSSATRGGGYRSRLFWPMPLLSKKARRNKVMSGGRYMSRAFWPMPLLSTKRRTNSVIKGGDTPFSRALGWPTVS